MYLLALLACRTNDLDTAARDADGDGYGYNEDCDDEAPEVHPDAEEICNGVDDDCDGTVDQGATDASAWSYDADADDYGAGTPVMACTAPERHVAQDGDCDDLDADSYPGAPERCDEVDNDCDEVVDEDLTEAWFQDLDGDGFGAGELLESCDPEPGWVADGSDCDDLDAESYPEAEERCDEADNDCDESVDEGVTTTYYLDGDGDLWGLETDTTEACSEPDGYVERPGDCDDGEWAVNPGATELCNGDDDDCDGDTDEDDAADASTWYIDGDADGYGVSDTTTKGCEQPSGYADNAEDCDDGEWAVNPGATELCNGDDDDCDGDTDEDDAADASTWYIDYDGDSYGDTAYTAVACDQPSGFVDNDDDCDDFVYTSNPGADEYCNGDDDDCDNTVDEDGAVDVSTWYEDYDGDSYGNASVSDDECDQPSGYVSDNTDCDDTDDTIYPGARERYNGDDDDCDNTVDEAYWVGSGADGSLSLSTSFSPSSEASGSRTEADAVSYEVAVISGTDVTVNSTPDGIVAGDEVLLLNLHGSDSAYSSVGTYEFLEVASVSSNVLTMSSAVSETYGESSNTDLSDQTLLIQRVPQYVDVSVSSGGELTADAWDGSRGGVLAFRATGTVTVASGGVITVDELGYEAGATGTTYNCDSYQGESYAGEGDGDGDGVCTAYNESYGHWVNNYGGGGAHITGAGGNYGGGATDGDSWTGGSATAPYAGDSYGDADLSTLFFGSGGGGVWRGNSNPGPGGDGAGILYIGAFEIDLQDSSTVTAIGGTTHYWATGTWTYGAGGGAGGSIVLIADTLTLATDAVDAQGGYGESTHIRLGGDGGVGRVRFDYNELNGYAQGSADATSQEADVSEPDPGYSATP